jgi:hypothetical protein
LVLRIGKTETDVGKRVDAQKRGTSEGLPGRNSPNDTLPLTLDAPLRVLFLRLLKADDRGGWGVIG